MAVMRRWARSLTALSWQDSDPAGPSPNFRKPVVGDTAMFPRLRRAEESGTAAPQFRHSCTMLRHPAAFRL